MFFHNLKYSLKILFKNKMLIFWTFAFPLVLGLFFHLAFANIDDTEKLKTFQIAYVGEENTSMKEALEMLSKEENPLFEMTVCKEEEAQQLLDEGKIVGYVKEIEQPLVVIKTNGVEQTILKTVVDEIIQNTSLMQELVGTIAIEEAKKGFVNIEEIQKKALDIIQNTDFPMENKTSENMSMVMIEFYTLLAMAALYGGILGSVMMNYHLANMSSVGKRSAITPVPKFKTITSALFASFITQLLGILLLLVFTICILHVDYGNHVFLVILLAFAGSLAGLSLGISISTLVKGSEATKTGIILSITMLGCFLSGMMGMMLKYYIDMNVPFLNKINPANMITDGFYALYYYETMNRYWMDLGSLLLFSFILIGISFMSLRRKKYDGI